MTMMVRMIMFDLQLLTIVFVFAFADDNCSLRQGFVVAKRQFDL